MSTLLQTLYSYHAWANVDLFNKLESVDRETHGPELQTALRLISHYYVVSRIFAVISKAFRTASRPIISKKRRR